MVAHHPGLDVGEVLPEQGRHVRVEAPAIGHRRIGRLGMLWLGDVSALSVNMGEKREFGDCHSLSTNIAGNIGGKLTYLVECPG